MSCIETDRGCPLVYVATFRVSQATEVGAAVTKCIFILVALWLFKSEVKSHDTSCFTLAPIAVLPSLLSWERLTPLTIQGAKYMHTDDA